MTGYCSSFHKQSKDPNRDNFLELNRLGQAAWRELCNGTEDAETGFYRFRAEHPGIIPECFRGEDNRDSLEQKNRRRKGLELIYGKPQNGRRMGGDIGRLRVLTGEPLQHRVLGFGQLAALKLLEFDIFSQFALEQVEYIVGALEPHLPEQCWYALERSEMKLHIHVLCKRGACDLGSNLGVVPDADLPTFAGYLSKRPLFDFENALGYLSVRQAQAVQQAQGSRVATRRLAKGLGARRTGIGLAEIEAVLGPCPGSEVSPETPKLHVVIIQDKNPKAVRSEISPVFAESKAARSREAA